MVYEGSIKSKRNYLSAQDAAKITVSTIKKKYKNKFINIVGRKKVKVKDFLKKVKKMLKIEKKIKFNNKKILGHYVSNPSTFKFKKGINLSSASYQKIDLDIKSILEEIKFEKNKK